MTTEAEAREKNCPIASAGQRGSQLLCVASECMMWRWASSGIDRRKKWARNEAGYPGDIKVEPARPQDVPATWEWIPADLDEDRMYAGWWEPEADAAVRRQGACGLVTAPGFDK